MKTKIALSTAGLVLAPLAFSANVNLMVLTSDGMGNDQLSFFDPDLGASSRMDMPFTGLAPGESILSLDQRPATGAVYAITNFDNIHTFYPNTPNLVQLGGTLAPGLAGSSFGFDFNPAFMGGQFARIISDTNNNRVVDGDNGGYLGTVEKTALFYAMGDLNEGENPQVSHIAYTNSVFGATSTQQYGIDTEINALVTVANNAGTLGTVGGLGINARIDGGFDIDGSTGRAFFATPDADGLTSTLYEIDLGSGTASELYSFQGVARGLTSIPEPSSVLLTGLAGLALLARRRR